MKPFRFLIPAASFLITLAAHAQETVPTTPTATPTATYLMKEVVVTGDRLPTPKDQVAGSLSVLTAEDLERSQQSNAAEALRAVPGVDVVQSGGPGKVTSLSLRGSGSERTRVYVDGVEVNDPMSTAGAFDLSHLTTDNLERIEVLRGSQSALYGPDATGGVVQLFTRSGEGPLHATLSGEVGERRYQRSALSVNGGERLLDYSIQTSQMSDRGFSVAAPDTLHQLPLESDGTKATVVSSRFGSRPASFLRLGLVQRYTEAKTDIDNGAFDDDPNHVNLSRESVLKGTLETQLFDRRWTQTVSFSQALLRFADQNDPDLDHPSDRSRDDYHGERRQAEWVNHLRIVRGHTISFGFENRQEWGDAAHHMEYSFMGYPGVYDAVFARRTARVNGWFVQDQASWSNKFFLSAGARYDLHDRYGKRATWRLAPVFVVPSTRTKLKATAGTGWKTPTLYQTVFQEGLAEYGIPGLNAERSLSYDAGVEQPLWGDALRVGLVGFDNRLRAFLDWDPNYGPYGPYYSTGAYTNFQSVRIRGYEATADAQPYRDALLRLAFHHMDTRNDLDGAHLLRRAQNRASLSCDGPSYQGARCGFDLAWTGRRFDSAYLPGAYTATQVVLSAYTLARFRAEWKVTGRCTLYGRVENLFARRYQEVYGYQTAPRSVYGGMRLEL